MTTLRQFCMDDLLKFNNVNLDVLTETYNLAFYQYYMFQWPEAFTVAVAPNGSGSSSNSSGNSGGAIMGYCLGKAEGDGELYHGHVSAVTVAPSYRRLGTAQTLMDDFEKLCIHTYNAYFVDLFVRQSNVLAQKMYRAFDYSTYRVVIGYYSGEDPEDALDMRKALPRDKHKRSVIPLDRPIYPEELEW